nr:MAG TPA: hypothetical protein [Caudoviricetes sp.]
MDSTFCTIGGAQFWRLMRKSSIQKARMPLFFGLSTWLPHAE